MTSKLRACDFYLLRQDSNTLFLNLVITPTSAYFYTSPPGYSFRGNYLHEACSFSKFLDHWKCLQSGKKAKSSGQYLLSGESADLHSDAKNSTVCILIGCVLTL